MRHSPSELSMMRAILTCLLLILQTALPAAGQDSALPQHQSSSASPHGPLTHLNDTLFLFGDLRRTLELVSEELARGDTSAAVEHHQQILSQSFDAFQLNSTAGRAESIREAAIQLLKSAPAAYREAWRKIQAESAAAELKNAVSGGSVAELVRVTRRYPLTDAGFDASVLLVIRCLEQSAMTDADAVLMSTRDLYSADRRYNRRLRVLEERVASALVRHASQHPEAAGESRSNVRLTTDTDRGLTATARPWPRPTWSWNESSFDFQGPEQLQQSEVSEFEGFSPNKGDAEDQLAFSNWKPVIRTDSIVLRMPSRLIGLDRLTGQLLWELQTDTGTDDPSRISFGNHIADSGVFGLMSFDSDTICFIDGFDRNKSFPRASPFLGRARGRFPGIRIPRDVDSPGFPPDEPSARLGTRLVAIRFYPDSPIPQLGWTVGDQGAFRYQIQRPASTSSSLIRTKSDPASSSRGTTASSAIRPSTAPSAIVATPELTGHRFLSAPVSDGNRLFALTKSFAAAASSEQVWLNCFDRSGGGVLWQQPIVFSSGDPPANSAETLSAFRTDVCIVSGGQVICSLTSGVLAAVSCTDGVLQWATSIRDEQPNGALWALNHPIEYGAKKIAFVPIVSEGVLICSAPASSQINALDTQTGRILWQVSRQSNSPELTGGAFAGADNYAVGAVDGKVVLIGNRHCRALDLHSGQQLWNSTVTPSTGRAVCDRQQCLIPESDGTVARVLLQGGRVDRVTTDFLPEGFQLLYGAVSSDHEFTWFTTQSSVKACLNSDIFLNRTMASLKQSPNLSDEEFADGLLSAAQAQLLKGDRSGALSGLMDGLTVALSAAEKKRTVPTVVHQFAAELLLQRTGQMLFSRIPLSLSETIDGGSSEDPQHILHGLALRPDQRLRKELFRTIQGFRAESVREVVSGQDGNSENVTTMDRRRPVSIDGDWQVRSDLLLDGELEISPPAQDKDSDSSEFAHRANCILFPGVAGSLEKQLTLAEACRRDGQLEAAEMLLLAGMSAASAGDVVADHTFGGSGATGHDDTLIQQYHSLLKSLRTSPRRTGDGSEVTESGIGTDSGLVPSSVPPEQARYRVRFLRIEQSPESQTSQTDHEHRVAQSLPVFSSPTQSTLRWFVEARDSGKSVIRAIDRTDGAQTDQLSLPFVPELVDTPVFDPRGPGIILLADHRQIVAAGCVRPGAAGLLWTRNAGMENIPSKPLRIGPVGANFCIWQSSTRLHCSHPLTGEELWNRECRQPPQDEFSRQLPIFGDEKVAVVVGPGNNGFKRFRTRDGRYLGESQIQFSPGGETEIYGRKLLYADHTARVRLYDGFHDCDMLEDQEPLFLVLIPGEDSIQQLPGGLAVVISRNHEIVLIDTQQNRVCFRTSVKGQLNTRYVFGLTAFIRSGRLFVCIQDEEAFGQTIDAIPQPGEPRLHYGRLFCLDSDTGGIIWSRRTEPSVIPDVMGDPMDLLVSWSLVTRSVDGQKRTALRKLRVQVVDPETGELLAEKAGLEGSTPWRCVYDASQKQASLHCLTSGNSQHSLTAPRTVITITEQPAN
jgi:outer membrane protein assembly factor BamB